MWLAVSLTAYLTQLFLYGITPSAHILTIQGPFPLRARAVVASWLALEILKLKASVEAALSGT